MDFLPNNLPPHSSPQTGEVLVDVLRNNLRLLGTSVACREGDCGACTVLVGRCTKDKQLTYTPITSCISPAGNAQGCHIVTVEGLSQGGLNPLQKIFGDFSGTQCGFCTPGFIVSLTGFLINSSTLSYDDAIAAIDGNICRCTGYKAIQRAIAHLLEHYGPRLRAAPQRIEALIAEGFLPPYFSSIPERIKALLPPPPAIGATTRQRVGGGTDLFVQKPHTLRTTPLSLMLPTQSPARIIIEHDRARVCAHTSIQEFCTHPQLLKRIGCLPTVRKLFASTQIRSQGTLGGNLVNASPIGDMANFLLALDSTLVLSSAEGERRLPQSQFYRGYKQLDLAENEQLDAIEFALPSHPQAVNFLKVSRRTHLDIASVNSAMVLERDADTIVHIALTAGGVAPSPLRLSGVETWLRGRRISVATVRKAVGLAQQEITPISDVRGSKDYKSLLLGNMITAHFLALCPDLLSEETLVP